MADTITAIALLVSSITALVTVVLTHRKVGRVQVTVAKVADEVTTLNGSTLAMLGDADESRRIASIPIDDRTPGEQLHVDTVPEP